VKRINKKTIKVIVIICIPIMIVVYYCSPISAILTPLSDEKYRVAYENCVYWTKYKSGFPNAMWINCGRVSVKPLPDDYKDYVYIIADGYAHYGEYFEKVAAEHWVFTIGGTSGHNFVILVCNSETNEVIGLIPIM